MSHAVFANPLVKPVPHRGPGISAPSAQIKTRERVRELAEVYTDKREVDAMLDQVSSMFPSQDDPGNTDRTFLEPASGHGNFLEEILLRKLAFVTVSRYGRGERYEHRILRCLSSIYGIDIDGGNVAESQGRLRDVIGSHLDVDLGAPSASLAFLEAMEQILATNIVCADALAKPSRIELIEYKPVGDGMFVREWSLLDDGGQVADLFSPHPAKRDDRPVHYSELRIHPGPVIGMRRRNGVP